MVKFEVNRSYFLRCGKIFISVFEILLQKWRSYDVDQSVEQNIQLIDIGFLVCLLEPKNDHLSSSHSDTF